MTPERFRTVVSLVLLAGVSIAAALIAIGFVAELVVGWEGSLVGNAVSDAPLTDFGSMLSGLAALRPIAITQLGLVVLLFTPIVRVAASVIGFALEGDRLYTAITIAVLAILLTSVLFLR